MDAFLGRKVSFSQVDEYASLLHDSELDALVIIDSGRSGDYPQSRVLGLPFLFAEHGHDQPPSAPHNGHHIHEIPDGTSYEPAYVVRVLADDVVREVSPEDASPISGAFGEEAVCDGSGSRRRNAAEILPKRAGLRGQVRRRGGRRRGR